MRASPAATAASIRPDRTLRIVEVLPTLEARSGGPPRTTLASLRALHRATDAARSVLLSTDHGLEPEWERNFRRRLPAGAELRLFPLLGSHTRSFSWPLVRWLDRHARQFDLLVVRALLHPVSTAAALVARRHGIPYVIVPHGTLSSYTFHHRNRALKKAWLELVERRTLDSAACIQFASRGEREDAMRLGLRAPTAVIPHPYAGATRHPRREVEEGLVLFLARLHPMKGLDLLLPAFARARGRMPGVRLVIAGSGPVAYERRLRRLAGERGLDDAVDFRGFVQGRAKRELLERAALFVLPSTRENYGLSLVEALAAGVPTVVTRTIDLAGELEEAGATVAVEPRVGALARAIERVLSSPGTAAAMAACGRRYVERNLRPDVVGHRLRELYAGIAGAGGAGRTREP